MSRGLVLLIVATAAASAQAAYSACYWAVNDAMKAVPTAAQLSACSSQCSANAADIQKFLANPNCSMSADPYDAATCDPIIANCTKCVLKAAKLLKADNTFDETAFKATTLQNKCSADAKFKAAYPTCKNSTMKYLNLSRLFRCLFTAVNP
ncbi:uncharacterized protein LOC108680214 isoform X1 [Hyalella azteca]|uniref:Uncharacterized protein LOC108680214 isoform X1 n=1 Tax=Hyalella azteca TaxID=294128 RepID=A0A8B7PGQ4_HYAAZ|nr:uncharacterized protein LOC108680214 isoform X1 [Hyalella azteca]